MSSQGLDIAAGIDLARQEMYGDWFRDPWGWPELTAINPEDVDAEEDLAIRKTRNREFHLSNQPHFHLIEVPKTRLGVRPAVVQDPQSRLAYLSAVHAGLNGFHSDLPSWVYGWRMREPGTVAAGNAEWKSYVEDLPKSDDQENFGLLTDITSFFASIRPERIQQIVYSKMGKVTAAHIIMDVIRAHDSLSTRSGLPQRSFASAVLAHTVMQPLDDSLAAALENGGSIVRARRWMDDISAEGEEGALFSLLIDLQERARLTGLEINASKTHLLPASETATMLRLEDLKKIKVPVQFVFGAYDSEPRPEPDLDILRHLEGAILSEPRSVPRTLAKAVLVSLAENREFTRCAEWLAAAKYLPHVADNLGRFIRAAVDEFGHQSLDVDNWFCELQASKFGRLAWVSSQYSLIFDTEGMPRNVSEALKGWLQNSENIQQIAIAIQRICTQNPVLGRNLIRARVDRTSDPILLRLYGLGLLMAGDSRTSVEDILTRDPRNHLLVKFLQRNAWAPPAVVKDFDESSSVND
ncbi:RNA-directed DNA polymerase [Actinomadura sp. NPDC023710]|uniref:RNA-directed DNA polymerase n=1 Tax=Actinomadura sp. NPDC023710 TaxID=3158219 RepID=UPI0033FD1FEE